MADYPAPAVDRRTTVLVLSPHYDDVPLSLVTSLTSGALSHCDVRSLVVFGRSNWTRWFEPTPGRAWLASWIRRREESRAARRFGYRWRRADFAEALLRGDVDPATLLDRRADMTGTPLAAQVAARVVEEVRATGAEVVLAPLGLEGHVDHLTVTAAALSAEVADAVPVAFYEDRPYAGHLDRDGIAAQAARLGPELEVHEVSGPITAALQRRVMECYPSQEDPYFEVGMAGDLARAAVERVWCRAGTPLPPVLREWA
ncbi:MAG: hypothetical protein ACKO04_04225 [Actinomycetes bacterium]